jgi:hypothetical protein
VRRAEAGATIDCAESDLTGKLGKVLGKFLRILLTSKASRIGREGEKLDGNAP